MNNNNIKLLVFSVFIGLFSTLTYWIGYYQNNHGFSSVIKKFRPESFKPGKILDLKGNHIGEHEGIINYTIGQRKGIKIADKDPLYVIQINSDKNEIIVGPKSKLGKDRFLIKNLNLLASEKEFEKEILVKVRSTGKLLKAKINLQNLNNAEVKLDIPENGISPGQACVFYKKDEYGTRVLGGGWI